MKKNKGLKWILFLSFLLVIKVTTNAQNYIPFNWNLSFNADEKETIYSANLLLSWERQGFSAYSSLAGLNKNRLALFFENGEKHPYVKPSLWVLDIKEIFTEKPMK